MKNKAVSKAMREKAEKVFTELQNCPNEMLRLVKGLKTDSKEVGVGRSMRVSDEKLCFSEKERVTYLPLYVRKDFMERIKNGKIKFNSSDG